MVTPTRFLQTLYRLLNTAAACFLAASACGGPRTSASYSIVTDTADAGGKRSASVNYTNDGSIGFVAGISTVAAPAETAKHGYIGQLYEVTGLVLNAGASNVNETATLQLAAWQFLDDASLLAVSASAVTWGIVSGPITGITGAGLVYQHTPATVQGTFGGFPGSLNLTVLDAIPDNFGSYSADGVGDAWQVQYFGQPPNANAGPLIDADHDGQTNAFEYTAGLIPTDANSVFRLRLESVPAQPGRKNLIFSPRLTDRTYTVKAKPSLLNGTFAPLGSSSFTDGCPGTHRHRPERNRRDEVLPGGDHQAVEKVVVGFSPWRRGAAEGALDSIRSLSGLKPGTTFAETSLARRGRIRACAHSSRR